MYCDAFIYISLLPISFVFLFNLNNLFNSGNRANEVFIFSFDHCILELKLAG